MRRDQIKTPGLHVLHHIERQLVDTCLEAVNFVEMLADRNTGQDSAEKLAHFFDEMAAACRRAHAPKEKASGKKSRTS